VLHGIAFQFELVFDDIEYAVLITVATIQDAFAAMWNSVAGGAADAINTIGGIVAKVPGLEDFGKSLQNREARTFEGGNVNVVEAVARERNKERAAEAEHIAGLLGLNGSAASAPVNGPGAPIINQTNQPNITVNVPPGTPADMANRVGSAALSGTSRALDLRATQAALSPTAG